MSTGITIGEFAAAAGVTPRILRHYEEQGLLTPERTANGYRTYAEADLETVARIRLMIDAGVGTKAIGRYLDCVASGDAGFSVEMCSGLRAELVAVADRLADQERRIAQTRSALDRIDGRLGVPSGR